MNSAPAAEMSAEPVQGVTMTEDVGVLIVFCLLELGKVNATVKAKRNGMEDDQFLILEVLVPDTPIIVRYGYSRDLHVCPACQKRW